MTQPQQKRKNAIHEPEKNKSSFPFPRLPLVNNPCGHARKDNANTKVAFRKPEAEMPNGSNATRPTPNYFHFELASLAPRNRPASPSLALYLPDQVCGHLVKLTIANAMVTRSVIPPLLFDDGSLVGCQR